MPMKKFIVKSVLAVCITFCCLFYLDMMYEQKVSTGMSEVNVFNFVPHNIQLANTGSSHGQCAFNWDALANERGYETFNFALTSQSFLYDYSLINMHKDGFGCGSCPPAPPAVWGFVPFLSCPFHIQRRVIGNDDGEKQHRKVFQPPGGIEKKAGSQQQHPAPFPGSDPVQKEYDRQKNGVAE